MKRGKQKKASKPRKSITSKDLGVIKASDIIGSDAFTQMAAEAKMMTNTLRALEAMQDRIINKQRLINTAIQKEESKWLDDLQNSGTIRRAVDSLYMEFNRHDLHDQIKIGYVIKCQQYELIFKKVNPVS